MTAADLIIEQGHEESSSTVYYFIFEKKVAFRECDDEREGRRVSNV